METSQDLLDVLWLIVCAVLVLMMQAGFACLESGLVRAKNSINVVIKNLADFCIAGFGFWLVGFGLMFGTSAFGLVGTSQFLFDAQGGAWLLAFFFFQMVFCGTATTIVSGAVAERMRFSGYFVCAAVLSSVIYPITGHWAWGGLATGDSTGWLARMGFVDFAGSTVVHGVGGWLALAAILIIGPRRGRFGAGAKPIEGHDLPLAVLGVFLLWVGWFGFNAGSTLHLTAGVAGIAVNTVLSPVAGGMAVLCASWLLDRRPKVAVIMNGVLAGLVGITACCHVVSPAGAVLVGAVSGLVLVGSERLLERLRIDDAVSAVPVHLFAGVWGTLAVALLGEPAQWGTGNSRWEQLGVQATGIAAIGGFAFVVGYLTLRLVDRVLPLRVSAEDERIGLNVAEHGANTALLDLLGEMDRQRREGDFSRPVDVDADGEVGQIGQLYNRVLERVQRETRRREQAVADMRRAKDTAIEANQAKSQFLASMSHELRTPLNAIIGFSELINMQVFGPVGNARYEDYLRDIHESGTHLLKLINDLLDLSKIEANKFELAEQEVDLAVVVGAAARLVQKTVDDKHLALDVAVADDLPQLRGDERVIRQILLNLLSNAVKFTPAGGSVCIGAALEVDGRVAITVADTGVGIARKDLARTLEPFGQLDNQALTSQRGTGLGLPLTRSLAQLHGGTLTLSSERNVGTTVVVRFPLWRNLRAAAEAQVAAA